VKPFSPRGEKDSRYNLDTELDDSFTSIHAYESCSYEINIEENEACDELFSLEVAVNREIKNILVDMGGYVSRNLLSSARTPTNITSSMGTTQELWVAVA